MPSLDSFMCAPRNTPRTLRTLAASAALLLLGACSGMHDIPSGTALADIQARYGSPTVTCPLPDGTTRLVWSTQPMGQYAWATQAGPDEKAGPIKQVLTDAAFRQVEIGVWGQDQLRCHFGPPAEVAMVGLPGVRQLIWSYRYRQDKAWNSLMHVYLSDDGVVQRMHPGPDPLFEPREWPW